MASVGIDTVGVAFPIDERKSRDVVFAANGRRLKLSGGGFVSVGVGESAWVEASLPKRAGGENVDGVSVGEAHRLIRELVSEACELVEPAAVRSMSRPGGGTVEVSAENPRLVRMDLVRDFTLRDPSLQTVILNGLAEVPRGGGVSVRRFSDGRTGEAMTLRVGPGAWAATLYDKCAETGGLAPEGSLRCEFRLRGRQLGSVRAIASGGSMMVLGDVSEDRCDSLRRAWFEHVGFGSWVGSRDGFWQSLQHTDLTDRERMSFAGWYFARQAGVQLALSDKSERKYRGVLRELDSRSEVSGRVRLDYDLGSEVVAA